ncbi:MAG: CHAP domain-containing protein [Oscillospiraceae bacterium]|nr:CHAP domain-containing protein [Oscillospiraceae bacterium]
MKKQNAGFTLVELVVTIAVASVVMLAATTTLTSYIRINKQGTDITIKQNEVRIVLEVMEKLAAEKKIAVVDTTDGWVVQDVEEDKPLFSYSNKAIYSGTDTTNPLMNGIETATAELSGDLLMLYVMTEKGNEYATSVYCRRLEVIPTPTEEKTEDPPAQSGNPFSLRSGFSESQSTDWTRILHAEARQNFLSILEGEKGSTGASLTTGEYFSEWYIGGYENNPGWNADTPWCACFVSWALDQCSGDLLTVPKFAHVEEFMDSFPIDRWKTGDPQPGDIIFFDWVENNTSFPQHVGVVTAVENGTVCTIEGNADGEVASRVYPLDDGRILGYGVLNWK